MLTAVRLRRGSPRQICVYFAMIASAQLFCGCRDCGEPTRDALPEASSSSRGPIMPRGMLTPLPDAAAAVVGTKTTPAECMSIARAKTSGEWIELQVGNGVRGADGADQNRKQPIVHWKTDSLFLTTDAMTLLHDPFAKALPGFDLFVPRLFDGTALTRLRTELTSLKSQLTSEATSIVAAKAKWGATSSFVQDLPDDATWLSARTALATTIDEIIELAERLEKKSLGLWVVGSS